MYSQSVLALCLYIPGVGTLYGPYYTCLALEKSRRGNADYFTGGQMSFCESSTIFGLKKDKSKIKPAGPELYFFHGMTAVCRATEKFIRQKPGIPVLSHTSMQNNNVPGFHLRNKTPLRLLWVQRRKYRD